MTDPTVHCSNCGGTDHVATYSFDMDLPRLVLCGVCAFAIVHDPDLFDEMRGAGLRPLGFPVSRLTYAGTYPKARHRGSPLGR